MSRLTMNNINELYTKTITDYLNNGYIISTSTSGGSYSNELCHIDLKSLSDKENVIRVWLLKGTSEVDGLDYFNNETLEISVRRYPAEMYTFWPNRGEEISSKVFFEVRGDKCYVDNMDELKEILKLRRHRFETRRECFGLGRNKKDLVVSELPKSVQDSILARIRSNRGMKRATLDCVVDVYLFHNERLKCRVNWEFGSKNGTILFA